MRLRKELVYRKVRLLVEFINVNRPNVDSYRKRRIVFRWMDTWIPM